MEEECKVLIIFLKFGGVCFILKGVIVRVINLVFGLLNFFLLFVFNMVIWIREIFRGNLLENVSIWLNYVYFEGFWRDYWYYIYLN